MNSDEAIQRLKNAKELLGHQKVCEAIDVAIEALENKPNTCSTCKYWAPYYEVMICKLYGNNHDCGGYEFCSRWEANDEGK